ncbi:MAG TPA: metallopeptidase family protein [Verrucomicrobiae bacterium]|nr:metallopeptidase family protein [Verrucomicrobiae bacterium]
MRLSARAFDRLVADGLSLIPDEIRGFMSNVEIVIEDEPSAELLEQLNVPPAETLFGLYQGVPLTERSTAYSALPDRIIIFRRPLLDEFDDPLDVRREVARTVIHEVAHHFGISDDRLTNLGWD